MITMISPAARCEQPLQVQFFFMFDRVKELTPKDPALAEPQPYKAVLEHDYNTLFGLGKQALFELAFAHPCRHDRRRF